MNQTKKNVEISGEEDAKAEDAELDGKNYLTNIASL